jgi:hypothetical protein
MGSVNQSLLRNLILSLNPLLILNPNPNPNPNPAPPDQKIRSLSTITQRRTRVNVRGLQMPSPVVVAMLKLA